MISPQEALRHVMRHSHLLPAESRPLCRALGQVVAVARRAPFAMPRFNNSAMDGFAVRARDTRGASVASPRRLRIIGTVYAGGRQPVALGAGEACKIMTGAPLPPGGDSVIIIEDAQVEGAFLRVDSPAEPYRHVRRRAEEVKKGSVLLRKGTVVHPGIVACLASFGLDRVDVVRRPSVAVIATGDETVRPGRPLSEGKIYDSNSAMIEAMLRHMGIETITVRSLRDRRAPMLRAVRSALANHDVLITLGGVSVGDHDYLRGIFDEVRVKQVFWRVRQKPGKPLYFGVKGKTLVFGLPGNPASAFTCFYVYVYPALRRLMGFRTAGMQKRHLDLASPVRSDAQRAAFLKGKVGTEVEVLPRQGSHMITSLVDTNCLVFVPAGPGPGQETGKAVVYRLPYADDSTI